jgi:23S rRNA pseudouridine2605 synthase
MMRLQKFLAEAGVSSRRAGERLIVEGKVEVNGQPARLLGSKVDPAHDRVTVEGQPVRLRRKIYVALHKPARVLCTRQDPAQRHTVGALLPAEWAHLVTVGRLDFDSEGLIFLSNDGEFCLKLTHPRYGVRKTYLATVQGRVEPRIIPRLRAGVLEGGEELKAVQARLISSNQTRSVLELVLGEGKNREVRRLLSALGLNVQRLVRIQIGPIRLGNLPPGRWRTLTETEIASLLGDYDYQPISRGGGRSLPGTDAGRQCPGRRRSNQPAGRGPARFHP